MFNMVKLNARNMALVHELIAANGGSPFIRRSELLRLHQELRGRKCNPYFITKNIQSKLSAREKLIHPRGTLTLQRYLDHEKRFPLAQAPGKRKWRRSGKKNPAGKPNRWQFGWAEPAPGRSSSGAA